MFKIKKQLQFGCKIRLKNGFYMFILCFILSSALVYATSLGDHFDGPGLKNPNWKWQSEPKEWDVGKTTKGWLHIIPELNQNLWSSDTSIRLYQETSDDFDVETHVVMDYKTDCIVAGLVAESMTDNNWTTLKFWGRAGDAILQWQHKAQEVVGNVPGASQPAGRVEVFLRMVRKGDTYEGYWKKAGKDSWTKITPNANKKLTMPLQIGIFAGICTGAGEATVEYEYFNDLINPFTAVSSAEKLAATWGKIKGQR